jgi:hypothetical protein
MLRHVLCSPPCWNHLVKHFKRVFTIKHKNAATYSVLADLIVLYNFLYLCTACAPSVVLSVFYCLALVFRLLRQYSSVVLFYTAGRLQIKKKSFSNFFCALHPVVLLSNSKCKVDISLNRTTFYFI